MTSSTIPPAPDGPPAEPSAGRPVVRFENATLAFGSRTLWRDLTLDVSPGEFVAVVGANGAGKTSLLRTLLGQVPLATGRVLIDGHPPRRGSARIGYVPQQRTLEAAAPIRGRDLVGLGLDGHRWGPGWPSRARRQRIDEAVHWVEAESFADAPLSLLSGGEQQRLRIAQALITEPRLLLCDEPLLSLDLRHQSHVSQLIHRWCVEHGTATLFVTHEINPILPVTDRVIYLARGQWRIGTPDEVLRSDVLSELYDSPVEVIRHGERIVVFGVEDPPHHDHCDEVL